ncbi:1-deoxy-D-xylulose-5-phosphate reductoisomerase [Clostridium arbusti]|uniref:1-deoxy-D-xylulose-5-phosphate reductoisomerase n=1 Tax=Clostridium arbusti TaxID=1137848 RepID=UPI000289783E|nr:1-deoxy-D-xylulose-5-phosphate reductoisomerase [Clostridium arbusti]
MKNISILGATGSIGTQTLDVIKNDRENLKLLAATANKNYSKIIDIINEFSPKLVALMDKSASEKVKEYCVEHNKDIEVLTGVAGLNAAATLKDIDTVVTSVVGMVGLIPTIEAIKSGKTIALANKETLVVGGEIVINEARKHKVDILPVDSEHGAIFQCINGNNTKDISKILLTASGGPFRGKSKNELTKITPQEALKHPKWNMGNKISIDSATLMNKGLEVIEAHWLFEVIYEDIQVVVHPQSIIHSMVEYCDGTVLSQMATTDMRLPIQYALNYPNRGKRIINKLDFYNLEELTFEKPDVDTFGCLKLAYEVGRKGGNLPTILNAANEIAVELFLNNKIKFLDIENIIRDSLEKFQYIKELDIDTILETDMKVRNYINNKYNI